MTDHHNHLDYCEHGHAVITCQRCGVSVHGGGFPEEPCQAGDLPVLCCATPTDVVIALPADQATHGEQE